RNQNAIQPMSQPTVLQESRKRTNGESDGHREKRSKAGNAMCTTISTAPTSRPSSIRQIEVKESTLSAKPELNLRSLSTDTSISAASHENKQMQRPSKLSVPLVVQLAQGEQNQYPILVDDITRPEMYEDNWLSYQEAAVTQL